MDETERQCFIMLCKRDTEAWCLRERVFGEVESHLPALSHIKKGDPGFLYNMSTDQLIGVFIATDEVKSNLKPDLWPGKYPAQVPVDCVLPVSLREKI